LVLYGQEHAGSALAGNCQDNPVDNAPIETCSRSMGDPRE